MLSNRQVSMETAARLKEHHADGAISVQVLKGSIRFTTLGGIS